MPSFCLYGMCHNLGSSSYQGYCDDYHMKRAWEREQKEKRQFSTTASSHTHSKDSLSVSLPSKAPSSEPQNKQCDTTPDSCNPVTQCASAATNT